MLWSNGMLSQHEVAALREAWERNITRYNGQMPLLLDQPMSLTTANLQAALQRAPTTTRRRYDPYWYAPPTTIWRTPSELFGIAVLYGIAITGLLILAELIR